MSELDMITVIFVTNILYMVFSSWHIARIGDEVHKILKNLKGQQNDN